MSYWEMDDGFLGHHKTRRAVREGWEALGMWTALRTYVAQYLTDGFIPDEEIDTLPNAPRNPRRWLDVLVRCGKPGSDGSRGAGLVDRVAGGFMLHDYSDHGLPAAEIRKRKADAAARQKRWRDSKNKAKTECVTRYETQTQRVSNAPPSHPIPYDLDLSDNSNQRPDRLEPDGPAAQRERPKHVARFERSMRAPNDSDCVAHLLFDAFVAETGKTGLKYDHKARELFERLVDENVTTREIADVVAGAKLDEWATGTAKLAASAILGSSEQRQRFAALARDPPRPRGTKAPRQPNGGTFAAEFLAAGKQQ